MADSSVGGRADSCVGIQPASGCVEVVASELVSSNQRLECRVEEVAGV